MVIFFMIDGLRPEAATPEHMPTLCELMARGAYTLSARSVMPCITLPCHMSIFHSVPPERHGVTTNVWSPMARPLPGLVDVARQAGKRCAFFFNWEPLRNLSQPGSLVHTTFRDHVDTVDGDDFIAAEAARTLAAGHLGERFDFAFIYFGTTDVAGHACGWLSPEYLAQAKRVDGLLERLLGEFQAGDHVLVHADHGGFERSHGTDIPENMTIPWVLSGPGIRAGHAVQQPVSLLDSAPTLARLLGLAPHHQWEGQAVAEALG